MLPHVLLRANAHLEADRIVLHYFTSKDEPWLEALIHEYVRFSGRKRSELHERLTLLRGGHRPHRHLREPVQCAGQRTDEPQHRVPGGGAGRRWGDR